MINRREQKKQQKYADFLATAKKLFKTKGIEGTAMHEISSHAGYGAKTLNRYFQSRNALILALLHDDERLSLQRAEKKAKKLSGGAIDRLCDVFFSYAEYADILADIALWREYEGVRVSEYNNLEEGGSRDLRYGIVDIIRSILELSVKEKLLTEEFDVDRMTDIVHAIALLNYHRTLRGEFTTADEAELAFKANVTTIMQPYLV